MKADQLARQFKGVTFGPHIQQVQPEKKDKKKKRKPITGSNYGMADNIQRD